MVFPLPQLVLPLLLFQELALCFLAGLAGLPNCHRREMSQPMTAERKGLSLGSGVVWPGKWNSSSLSLPAGIFPTAPFLCSATNP